MICRKLLGPLHLVWFYTRNAHKRVYQSLKIHLNAISQRPVKKTQQLEKTKPSNVHKHQEHFSAKSKYKILAKRPSHRSQNAKILIMGPVFIFCL